MIRFQLYPRRRTPDRIDPGQIGCATPLAASVDKEVCLASKPANVTMNDGRLTELTLLFTARPISAKNVLQFQGDFACRLAGGGLVDATNVTRSNIESTRIEAGKVTRP